MKPNLNYVPRKQLEDIARAAGCGMDMMAACIKVWKGKSGNKLYIAATKDCARVDLSGFDHPNKEWVVDLGGNKFGRVHQMLRFDRPAADIKAAFKAICEGLEGFEPHPKVKNNFNKMNFGKGSKRKDPEQIMVIKSDETAKEHMERLVKKMNMIKEYSKQSGVPVSPKTIKEFEEKMGELKKKLAPQPLV
jgi:hypothetical protein